jgi:hypothetical protein
MSADLEASMCGRLAHSIWANFPLGAKKLFHPTPRAFLVASFLILAVFLVPNSLFAQTANTGTVEGIVTDPTGASVVDASVTMVDAGTGVSRSATTNDSGRYFFANVVPGKYTLTINKSGFSRP